ncbi:Uu.00g090990.m01.CDS01 [Anthostomella pinea]|uniref:Uu.00g090990.m01.CDS01 n=1 Tax=Anthostomella pinea TaxID=933095 RepID=A0AAI8VHJ9_9PEZI|nr:Uu.00g090990.m01.CDS01 [Anthostomella pinea]
MLSSSPGGRSTSVGSNAVQLARAAGYEVLATASPKNFEYLKSLGASMVFDCKQPDTVSRIIDALQSKSCAGALAIGAGSLEACIDIVAAVPGRKFVSQASRPADMSDMPTNMVGLFKTIFGLLWWNISTALRARSKGVSTKFIWGGDVVANEVGSMTYQDFLPEALASGQYHAKPDPKIVGKGLESLQGGIDTYKRGVSAAKVVVSLICKGRTIYDHSATNTSSFSSTKSLAPQNGHSGYVIFIPLYACGKGHTEGSCDDSDAGVIGDDGVACVTKMLPGNEPDGIWDVVTVD